MNTSREVCRQCGREYTQADLAQLTDLDMAICVKEGVDLTDLVAITCPRCGYRVFQRIPHGMKAPKHESGRMGRLSIRGRDYLLMSSAEQLGRSVARGQAAALITTWDAVGAQMVALARAIVGAGVTSEEAFKRITSAENAVVGCTSCGVTLTGHGLEMLMLITGPDSFGFSGMGAGAAQLSEMRAGHCPNCKNTQCYYVVDPPGLPAAEPPTAPPVAADTSRQHRWFSKHHT